MLILMYKKEKTNKCSNNTNKCLTFVKKGAIILSSTARRIKYGCNKIANSYRKCKI